VSALSLARNGEVRITGQNSLLTGERFMPSFPSLQIAPALLAASLVACLAGPAKAQDAAATYPDRAIRLVVPYPPGGTTDPTARLIAAKISERLKQPVVVENKPGAAGSIGTEHVVRAAPDGYTLLFHTSVITVDPSFKKNLAYDVQKDLVPVGIAATGPYVLAAHPSLPANTLAEFIAYAKANPGKINYGSAGVGSSGHLIGERFKAAAGIDMVHIPYKGGGPSIVGLTANEVQVVFDTLASKPLIDAGKLKALAVTDTRRWPGLPNVPTIMEGSLKDFSVTIWVGMFAPAKTPPAIVEKLNTELRAALADPTLVSRFAEIGVVPNSETTAEARARVDQDIARWRQVIEAAKIEPQ
jgi:tripartite-type tricarboxylate transporter receptor subunit TctC